MFDVQTATPGRGAAWLLEGFQYFRRSAGAWIGIGIIIIVTSIVSGLLPLAGLALQVLLPIFTGGLMIGCRQISDGGELNINHLFAGFSRHTGNLLLIGVMYTLGIFVIMFLMMIMAFITVGGTGFIARMMDGDTRFVLENSRNILLVILVGLLVYIPLLMTVWFAPALVVLEDAGALTAMKYSFIGCLKNILPLLVYGLVSLPLSLLATIPLMLGWFILGPMIVASIYIASKDIYRQKSVS